MIMRHGAVVEMGATERVFGNPLHPYTKALLASVPQLHTKWKDVEAEPPLARRPTATPRRRAGSSRSRTTTSSRSRDDGRDGVARDVALGRRARRRASRGRSARPGSSDVVWRSSRNPIIPRDLIPRANSIFNSAVVPYGDGFAGVFRVDDTRRVMNLHAGRSADGIDWAHRRRADRVRSRPTRACARRPDRSSTPTTRASTWLEDRYYVTWCNGYHGPTIGVG